MDFQSNINENVETRTYFSIDSDVASGSLTIFMGKGITSVAGETLPLSSTLEPDLESKKERRIDNKSRVQK